MILDIITMVLIILGAILSLCAAIGLLRFPDLMSRMHASAKPQILGLMLILCAAALQNPHWGTLSTLVVIILFQMGTTPVSVHMIGRAGYRTKHLRASRLYVDDLAAAVERAEERAQAEERERGQAAQATQATQAGGNSRLGGSSAAVVPPEAGADDGPEAGTS